ncbi:MAG: twitching motility protein PilU [Francisellaceae bacterium]
MIELKQMLKTMIENEGSDLYLTFDAPPSIKAQGELLAMSKDIFKEEEVDHIAKSIMDDKQINAFLNTGEMNLALYYEEIGRFRVNIFKQRNETGMVLRHIKTDIPNKNDLGIPEIMTSLVMQKRGLVLFVGGTGSGKSTSLASLIDYRNENDGGHIVTIEDPIEYLHNHKKSIITQREVGTDTESFREALKNTLRQAPDVILIGEIRDRETMEHAITFAETGHLCISTLHANNANQAVDRILHFFPDDQHKKLQLDLSLNLKGIISQRLIPSKDGKRAMAAEILINTPMISEQIKRGDVSELKETMSKSENIGMQTFDGALFHLYKADKITLDEALKNADSTNNLRLRVKLDGNDAEATTKAASEKYKIKYDGDEDQDNKF